MHPITRISVICLLFILSSSINAQHYLKTGESSSVMESDSAVLCVNNARGTIIWQASNDSLLWNIIGNTNDSLFVRIDSTASYRAWISDGTCDPIYSDTIALIEKITFLPGNTFTVDDMGGIFVLANGIKVKIPLDAVTSPKTFQVEWLTVTDIQNLGALTAQESERFFSGVSISTDEVIFTKPISFKLPVSSFQSKDVPVLREFNANENKWAYSDETLIISSDREFIEIIIDNSSKNIQSQKETSQTKAGPIFNFFLELYGDLFLSEDECRETIGEIITRNFDDTPVGSCNVITVEQTFKYPACDPKQSDEFVARHFSSSCIPVLDIDPSGNLMLKQNEPLQFNLKLTIGNVELPGEKIYVATSENDIFSLTTDEAGKASFTITGSKEGSILVTVNTDFNYFRTILSVRSAGGNYYKEIDEERFLYEKSFTVTVYDDCTDPDLINCQEINCPDCESVKEKLIATAELDPESQTIEMDEAFQINVLTFNYKGVQIPNNQVITWSSSAVDKATVVNGLVTGVSPGVATITATFCDQVLICTVIVKTDALVYKGTFSVEKVMDHSIYMLCGCQDPDTWAWAWYYFSYLGSFEISIEVTPSVPSSRLYATLSARESTAYTIVSPVCEGGILAEQWEGTSIALYSDDGAEKPLTAAEIESGTPFRIAFLYGIAGPDIIDKYMILSGVYDSETDEITCNIARYEPHYCVDRVNASFKMLMVED